MSVSILNHIFLNNGLMGNRVYFEAVKLEEFPNRSEMIDESMSSRGHVINHASKMGRILSTFVIYTIIAFEWFRHLTR